MTVAAFITRMRLRQASLFSDTVTVSRVTAPGAVNPSTGAVAAPTSSTVYAGPGLVRPNVDTVVASGGETVQMSSYKVKVPADTPVNVGDNITVNTSTYDAGLVGAGLRVMDVQNNEWQIARLLICDQQTPRPT